MNVHVAGQRAIIILGGGASGVLLAAHLLRSGRAGFRVTLIEKRERIGLGVAYSTPNLHHVLNVPASGMSAFPDQPDHFWDWLRGTGLVPPDDPHIFPPRFTYGQYLQSLVAEAQGGTGLPRFSVVTGECVGLSETASGVEVWLDNGTSVVGHAAVLAVGHEERQMRGRGLAVRAGGQDDIPLDPDAKVMILGSGLSMVDAWLSLAGHGHKGPVLVVSRNGLLPRRHKRVAPMALDAADVPLGTGLVYFSKWFMGLVEETVAAGGDWRAVVDGLRPFSQRIWQSWSVSTRRRFLNHLRPLWNIHRHRLPPDLHDGLTRAVDQGQITMIAGTFLEVARAGDRLAATIRRRGHAASEVVEVDRVYDCGGVAVNVEESSNPLVRHLVQTGPGRPDPLHIGLDVTLDCALIGEGGKPSRRLFAIGPLTRSAFFEIESVPEIRVQAQTLARRLLDTVTA